MRGFFPGGMFSSALRFSRACPGLKCPPFARLFFGGWLRFLRFPGIFCYILIVAITRLHNRSKSVSLVLALLALAPTF